MRVTRFEVAGDVNPETRKQRKSFRQFTPDGRGDWKPGLSGLQPPLYRLTALQAAPAGSLVYVVEGEAKAELLRGWALTATTSIMGAEKFRPEHADELSGHDIVILPDNDDAGRKHCALVAGMLTGKARTVKVLELPGLQHKGDVIDWQRAGGTAAELARLTATIGSNGKHHGDAETPFSYGNENSPSLSTGETAIEVRPGQLHILATEGEAALCSSGLPIFQRGHSLVQPVTTEVPASNSRTTIASGLAELTLPAMLDKLSQAATWEKWNARRKEMVACDPPDNVAKIILSRAGFWNVPPIAGIITAPTLRSDGTILEAPGYDAITRLYHAVDPALRRLDMPQRPTRADAARSLSTLKDLLTGFPFCTAVDTSVALSAMITPVVRGALAVVPMHAFRAPTAGTGKSYFVDLIGVIATGRISPVISVSGREEETEKRLAGLLLAGYPMISLDNVNGELGGDLLCQAIERPLIRVRRLGASDTIEIENRCCIFANGNNLRTSGDATRRTLRSNLDAGVERPELRTFDSDPVGQVLADRGTYIAACLTIVRAYVLAGSPDKLPPLASFTDWSNLVRSALCWLGCADPCDSIEAARDDDPELGELRELLDAWKSGLTLNQTYTARALVDAAEGQILDPEHGDWTGKYMLPDLREVLLRAAGDRGAISAKLLGEWLVKFNGRIAGELRLSRDAKAHGNVAAWMVSAIA